MKVLVIGSDFNSYLSACFIKAQTPGNDVFLTRDENEDDGIITVEIKPNDIIKLKEFVKNNGIDFTIVYSGAAVLSGITEAFNEDDLCILAPDSQAANVFFNNAVAKKLMYKLKIPTPRFGIFDKENTALDYARNVKYPVFVKFDNALQTDYSFYCKNFSEAKVQIQKIFEEPGNKAVIENVATGEYFNVYFISDGYNAYPLASVKNISADNAEYIISPAEKVSENITVKILQNVVYPLIDDIASFSSPFKGIFGLKVAVNGNDFSVSELSFGFCRYDIQAFLSLADENILELLYKCANGALAQTGDYVAVKNQYSFTGVIGKNDINGSFFEDNDMFIDSFNDNYVISALSSSIGAAERKFYFNTEDFLSENVKNEFSEIILNEELRI